MTEIINTSLIDLNMHVTDKFEAIKKLGRLLEGDSRLNSYDEYVKNVNEREELTTTGIGFGIAIPHGKTDAVKTVSVTFGRLETPIDWKSLDGQPVQMIFQLAVPESSRGDEHLKLISALSRQLIHEEFRNKLKEATSEQEIIDLIGSSINSTLEV